MIDVDPTIPTANCFDAPDFSAYCQLAIKRDTSITSLLEVTNKNLIMVFACALSEIIAVSKTIIRSIVMTDPVSSTFCTFPLLHRRVLHLFGTPLNLMATLAAASVICTLLAIGNIEANPGPFPCKICPIVPETIASSIRHQHYHSMDKISNITVH
ncbi:Glutamate 5-kinase [Frankliniella fusca]|uniref:Glutamate 5-kinase n=1 Tax=Frankliniella fusca TaxID=407009 RepID=A0AAE1GYM5_9NEOP|nr:Glutamate 5-kinase [Frankliniella fusca]